MLQPDTIEMNAEGWQSRSYGGSGQIKSFGQKERSRGATDASHGNVSERRRDGQDSGALNNLGVIGVTDWGRPDPRKGHSYCFRKPLKSGQLPPMPPLPRCYKKVSGCQVLQQYAALLGQHGSLTIERGTA